MTDPTNLQVRGSADRLLLQDSLGALKAVSSIRKSFILILFLALLVPLATFIGVRTDRIEAPAEGTAVQASEQAVAWYDRAERLMGFAPFVARLMTILLIVTYLMGTNISLSGRLGGAQHSIVAFFWAVLLMLFLIPWNTWVGGGEFPIVFYDVDRLLAEDRNLPGPWDVVVAYYSKFLVVPILGLLAAVVADNRFGKCYQEAIRRVRQQLEISVH